MSITKNNRLTPEELQKLRSMDFSKQRGFVKAETMLAQEVGAIGCKERDEFNANVRLWYYGEALNISLRLDVNLA